jgi:hypothetical protein
MKPCPDEAGEDQSARGEQSQRKSDGREHATEISRVPDVGVQPHRAESRRGRGELRTHLSSQCGHPAQAHNEARADENQAGDKEKGLGE